MLLVGPSGSPYIIIVVHPESDHSLWWASIDRSGWNQGAERENGLKQAECYWQTGTAFNCILFGGFVVGPGVT